MPASPDFEGVLQSLVESNVRFVLIGGLAMIAQGSANLTRDIDCLYDRSPENIRKIVDALRTSHPKLRTPREPVSILWDAATMLLPSRGGDTQNVKRNWPWKFRWTGAPPKMAFPLVAI